jgi:hypothetical protein
LYHLFLEFFDPIDPSDLLDAEESLSALVSSLTDSFLTLLLPVLAPVVGIRGETEADDGATDAESTISSCFADAILKHKFECKHCICFMFVRDRLLTE